MSETNSSMRIGMIALILGVLLFSTVEVAAKLMQTSGAVAGKFPFWLACFRSIMTGLLLAPLAMKSLRQRGVKLTGRDVLILSGLGLVGMTLMQSLFHLGITFLPANIAALLFSCNPVFVVLFAALFLSEKITLRNIVAIGLCLTGIFVLARERADGMSLTGILLMVGSTIAFALYTVFSKKVTPRYGALAVIAFAALIGGIILLPIALLLEGAPLATYGLIDWAGMFYLAIFGTAIGFFLYIYGIGHVGAGAGSMVFFLKPFAAAFFAWLVLGEKFSTPEYIAGVFILSGMIVALAPTRKNRCYK